MNTIKTSMDYVEEAAAYHAAVLRCARRARAETVADQRRFACPKCEAKPGSMCKTGTGRNTANHKARTWAPIKAQTANW